MVTFLLVCLLIVIVFLQVIARYLLPNPWLWTVDLSLFCLIWSTFLGAAICVRHNSHFVIDLWPAEWKKTIKALSTISLIVTVAVSLFYVFQGFEYAINSKRSLAGMTNISMFYFLSAIPIGSLLMTIFCIEGLLEEFSSFKKEENSI